MIPCGHDDLGTFSVEIHKELHTSNQYWSIASCVSYNIMQLWQWRVNVYYRNVTDFSDDFYVCCIRVFYKIPDKSLLWTFTIYYNNLLPVYPSVIIKDHIHK